MLLVLFLIPRWVVGGHDKKEFKLDPKSIVQIVYASHTIVGITYVAECRRRRGNRGSGGILCLPPKYAYICIL